MINRLKEFTIIEQDWRRERREFLISNDMAVRVHRTIYEKEEVIGTIPKQLRMKLPSLEFVLSRGDDYRTKRRDTSTDTFNGTSGIVKKLMNMHTSVASDITVPQDQAARALIGAVSFFAPTTIKPSAKYKSLFTAKKRSRSALSGNETKGPSTFTLNCSYRGWKVSG